MCDLEFDRSLNSYLSPNVHRTVCDAGLHVTSHHRPIGVAFANGILQWNALSSLLTKSVETSEEYYQRVKDLAPVFADILVFYESAAHADFKVTFDRCVLWTGQLPLAARCWQVLKEKSPTSASHALLLLTALLERALGDLVTLRNNKVPSLLRDLLCMPELQELLCDTVIQFLLVVIGPPTSLNLRNIVWHGFLKPGELPIQYPYTILCIIVSIGWLLEEKGILKVPHRAFIEINQPMIFPDFSLDQSAVQKIDQLFNESKFVAPCLIQFWSASLHLHVGGRHGEAVAMLLPQLELALRRIFVSANSCSERILTAENSTLFTTLDEILDKFLPNKSDNQIVQVIESSYFSLLVDFLMYPLGPRVRDHVSHGEVNFGNIPSQVARHLICMCIAFAAKFLQRPDEQPEFIRAICMAADNYESQYHPISVTKQQLITAAENISMWTKLPRPAINEVDKEIGDDIDTNLTKSAIDAFDNFCRTLSVTSEERCKQWVVFLEPFSDSRSLIKSSLEDTHYDTVYRYSGSSPGEATTTHEQEILRIMIRVAKLVETVSQQVVSVATERHRQWLCQEMRSRQRTNYVRLLKAMPVMSTSIRLVVLTTVFIFHKLDELKLNRSVQMALIKRLKLVQKFCENLMTNTNITVNRWDETAALSADFNAKILAMK